MVDLVVTPADVVAGSGASVDRGSLAGEAIEAGELVYMNTETRKWALADTNSATVEARRGLGIALNGAALNQPLAVLKSGDISLGAVLTAGTDYYASDTPGGICPRADVGAGEAVCMVGLAKTTSVLTVDIQFPGVTL